MCIRDRLKQRQPIETSSCSALQLERLELLKQVASGRLELEQLPEGMRQSLSQLQLSQERSQLRHLLVDLGHWDPHQLVSLEGTVWSSGFSEDLFQEAERLEQEANQEQPSDTGRVDLTSQRCVTIDDADTRDIDDGLAIETTAAGTTRIWIHIADPCLLYTSPSPRDLSTSRMPSSA